MNERQNMVVATAVSVLCLVVLFLCPWHVESSGELKWSPIYQPPMSYVRSYEVDQGGSRIEEEEAHIAYGYLALEVLVVVVVGGVLYVFSAGSNEADEPPASPDR